MKKKKNSFEFECSGESRATIHAESEAVLEGVLRDDLLLKMLDHSRSSSNIPQSRIVHRVDRRNVIVLRHKSLSALYKDASCNDTSILQFFTQYSFLEPTDRRNGDIWWIVFKDLSKDQVRLIVPADVFFLNVSSPSLGGAPVSWTDDCKEVGIIVSVRSRVAPALSPRHSHANTRATQMLTHLLSSSFASLFFSPFPALAPLSLVSFLSPPAGRTSSPGLLGTAPCVSILLLALAANPRGAWEESIPEEFSRNPEASTGLFSTSGL